MTQLEGNLLIAWNIWYKM